MVSKMLKPLRRIVSKFFFVCLSICRRMLFGALFIRLRGCSPRLPPPKRLWTAIRLISAMFLCRYQIRCTICFYAQFDFWATASAQCFNVLQGNYVRAAAAGVLLCVRAYLVSSQANTGCFVLCCKL